MTNNNTVHIIGAGLAGLSTALQLSLMGRKVVIHESAPYAGGRCRSYHDREMGCRLDNGNHLVLAGNVAVNDYLLLTGAMDSMRQLPTATFPFMDLPSGERWSVNMSPWRLPWWLGKANRRPAGVSGTEILAATLRLMAAKLREDRPVTDVLRTSAIAYSRFWEPLAIAALNTEPEIASAHLLANLCGQSFFAGGHACRPMIPKLGLSESFVAPCLNVLRQHQVEVRFGHRLRRLVANDEANSVHALDFGDNIIKLNTDDWVVLAVPPWVVTDVAPWIQGPNDFRSIVNLHYRVNVPTTREGFVGLSGGLAEWVFARGGVLSVTISAADRYKDAPQEKWAQNVWRDLARLYNLDPTVIPQWRLVREKRATFTATPQQNTLRPSQYTGWHNLALAGDWTNTGLPSTIEGALRSGIKAAQVVMRWS